MRTPKGTRVFYPDESERRRKIENVIEETIRSFGFQQIRTPALEEVEVYKEKSGEQIVDELFLLDNRVGSRELALTPELTPTVGRMVSSNSQRLKQPIRWYSTSRFWRYEAVQQGRFREFWQTNVDLFGVSEPLGEIELLEMAVETLSSLGISNDQVSIKVSDRRILESIADEFVGEQSTDELMRVVDKKRKMSEEEYRDKLGSLGIERIDEFNRMIGIDTKDGISNEFSEVGEPIVELFDRLDNYSDWLEIDISVARGLDYYSGIVFEAFDSTGSVDRSLIGGGRYDNLIQNYDNQGLDAVGFAFGYATLEEALESYNGGDGFSSSPDIYIVRFEETSDVSRRISRELRRRGFRVERTLEDRSIGSQFELADDRNATYCIVPGPDEVSEDEVLVQEMEIGEQERVKISDLEDAEFDSMFDGR